MEFWWEIFWDDFNWLPKCKKTYNLKFVEFEKKNQKSIEHN
jgi:hypothetical protein